MWLVISNVAIAKDLWVLQELTSEILVYFAVMFIEYQRYIKVWKLLDIISIKEPPTEFDRSMFASLRIEILENHEDNRA